MKYIYLIILVSILASCNSQKKLQRRIEKNGIKESISFVVLKYPEHFKKESTVISDTVIISDTIKLNSFEVSTVLKDSLDYFVHYSDSLRLVVHKKTGVSTVFVTGKTIYLTDTIIKTFNCPELICPDVEKLQSNLKKGMQIPSFIWLIIAFLIGLYTPKIFKIVLGFFNPLH